MSPPEHDQTEPTHIPVPSNATPPPAPSTPGSMHTRLLNDSPGGGSRSGSQPEKLGVFRIEKVLGQGGMGVVYLAIDQELERPAAVKVIAPSLADSDMAVERLRVEARAAARLTHPNIVSVYAFGEEAGLNYIAYEFIDGVDISTLIRQNGPLSPLRALQITKETAQALRFAWVHHIVHRDIKPANLLVTKSGTVKVADFGLAKRLDMDSGLTSSSMVMGSPAYMSPEQGMGGAVDFRSDIYSLGCTLFACLTGAAPFQAETPLGVMMMHAQDPLPEPDDVRNLLGGELSTLLQRMMAKKPEERFASYDELVDELDRLIDIANGQSGESAKRKTAKAKKSTGQGFSKKHAIAALAICGFALFGFFAWLVLSGRGTEGMNQTVSASAGLTASEFPSVQTSTPPVLQTPSITDQQSNKTLQNLVDVQTFSQLLRTGRWNEAQMHLAQSMQNANLRAEERQEYQVIADSIDALGNWHRGRLKVLEASQPFQIPTPEHGTVNVQKVTSDYIIMTSQTGIQMTVEIDRLPPSVANGIIRRANQLSPLTEDREKFLYVLYSLIQFDPSAARHYQRMLADSNDPEVENKYNDLFQTWSDFTQLNRPTGPPAMRNRPGGRTGQLRP